MNSHIRVMGILWAIYSGFRIVMALWTIVLGRTVIPMIVNMMPHDGDVNIAPILQMMGGFYLISGIYSILTGGAGFWAAWALLKHERSGRLIALVVAVISLLSIPIGTALGVYTLVILVPRNAEQTYERLAATA